MLSLEISLNGELKSVAGVPNAESIEARVFTAPQLDETVLVVSGSVEIQGEPNAEAAWLSAPLQLGDVVSVRLVEHVSPTVPTLHRYDPSTGASDGVPISCSFCGKSSNQVEGGMLASSRAVICRACIQYLHTLVADEGCT
ncbi:MAG: hypothetical protein J0I77_13935 [Rudaea sp.]|uniref:ClpX C4-type zinc finger protein n=1 Tax=unclassified Rudaea TaxID=2627037 RepID=UPI0014858171|nr:MULTISPECIES: ClpX C4-type zinc finger protein [unclassified Rudaea]MBN8886815.1 hypothetical protein [Rudaea sp.]